MNGIKGMLLAGNFLYSFPFPSFALRWSSTSISFALPARGALSSKS